jgi:chemotaxis protein CheX
MQESEVFVFVEGTQNYFEQTTGSKANIGVPYLKDEKPVILEYTGVIGISGVKLGCVYFTAEKELLRELAREILGEEPEDEATISDIVGEITNTISGNAREAFGSVFMISVPVSIEGKARNIKLPPDVQSFVIPITWKDYRAFLVVGLE